ncbi:hypothetical protein ACFVTP_10125 [Streptomyces celluloflavus]|uniref:hypothetical protein n=1 Tax=Streptomyces celluloflavus TaxID=58344 RepID=UPI0036D83510
MPHRPSHFSRRQMIAAQVNASAANARHRDRLAASLDRARTECDALESELSDQHDETANALRAAITRIRTALDTPEPRQ